MIALACVCGGAGELAILATILGWVARRLGVVRGSGSSSTPQGEKR